MSHAVISQSEWLAAHKALLAREKELTKARDALSAARRELPWVKVEKNYVFDGPAGKQSLTDLFDRRSQLIVYHFMFGPDWNAGCPHCSHWADNFNGIIVHLNQRDVTMLAVSRAPIAKLEAYRKRMGWGFEWVSSLENDFNFDFNVSFTPEEVPPRTLCTISCGRIRKYARASASFSKMNAAISSAPIRLMRAVSTC